MKNIVIIGAGQLGSRHLQGLKSADLEMSIFVVDTNIKALELAEERYHQVAPNDKISGINFYTDFGLLPKELDLVIVATGSLARAQLTSTLVRERNVKNIIFEKFLFPSIASYTSVLDLLTQHKIKAWVNCPRRMFTYFDEIKEIIANEKNVEFKVTGGEWGLACNSIHFIDIFAYLSGTENYTLDVSKLDSEIIASKRPGYVEFTGTINGTFANQQQFAINATKGESNPPLISIHTDNYKIVLNETKAEMAISKNDKADKIVPIQMLFQSQLTGILATQILNTGKCKITPFAESCTLHLTFLEPLVHFYNSISNKKGDSCPIT